MGVYGTFPGAFRGNSESYSKDSGGFLGGFLVSFKKVS